MHKHLKSHVTTTGDKMNDKKNQIDENETRIKNTITTGGKHDHTTGYYYSYSCKACGNPFSASPPDNAHKFSSVYQCWKFD
jgi:hypothetical protein